MISTSIIGYHTCNDRGGYEFICNSIPFLSEPGEDQWLTQGYYFWTDSPYWAENWNRGRPNVIGKFIVSFDEKHKFLDLVGNVSHQEEFEELKGVVLEEMEITDSFSITVNQIISFFREHSSSDDERFSGFFDYVAIKAQDERYVSIVDFIEPKTVVDRITGKPKTMRAKLRLRTRQQLCVFSEGRGCIKFSGFHHPQTYQERFMTIENGSSI
ncbi:hypothetical protein [Pectobacterium brasiliense]|uniref:hypothetical protein n=1 Tax=Pectobacterium brasiliense TaxID=180957 RepID=UPI0015DF47E6|nr:hypothetical protein [Pectobacterium brasiliense]MBA0212413.1 hypothetical protein [Pectobacterium brasiliense]